MQKGSESMDLLYKILIFKSYIDNIRIEKRDKLEKFNETDRSTLLYSFIGTLFIYFLCEAIINGIGHILTGR
jgi:hypothetical protein